MMPILAGKGWEVNKSSGFTLLELLLVLAVLAMASSLVIAKITGNKTEKFRLQIHEAVNVLNYARRIAIVKGLPSTAKFMASKPADSLQNNAKNPAGHWRSRGARLSYVGISGREDTGLTSIEITFYPQGGSTGGILNFMQNGIQAAIFIDPITGRIKTTFAGEG